MTAKSAVHSQTITDNFGGLTVVAFYLSVIATPGLAPKNKIC